MLTAPGKDDGPCAPAPFSSCKGKRTEGTGTRKNTMGRGRRTPFLEAKQKNSNWTKKKKHQGIVCEGEQEGQGKKERQKKKSRETSELPGEMKKLRGFRGSRERIRGMIKRDRGRTKRGGWGGGRGPRRKNRRRLVKPSDKEQGTRLGGGEGREICCGLRAGKRVLKGQSKRQGRNWDLSLSYPELTRGGKREERKEPGTVKWKPVMRKNKGGGQCDENKKGRKSVHVPGHASLRKKKKKKKTGGNVLRTLSSPHKRKTNKPQHKRLEPSAGVLLWIPGSQERIRVNSDTIKPRYSLWRHGWFEENIYEQKGGQKVGPLDGIK